MIPQPRQHRGSTRHAACTRVESYARQLTPVLLALCALPGARAAGPLEFDELQELRSELRLPWPPPVAVSPERCQTAPLRGQRRTIDVGPGREHEDLNSVPWLALEAGDVVNIHFREAPYATKFALRARGTAERPVIVNGVTDAKCRRPAISAANATTASDALAAGYFETPAGEALEGLGAIVLARGAADPWGWRPAYVQIRNLAISGASSAQSFIAHDARPRRYARGAAAIHASAVAHLTIENCEISRNDNGVFVNSRNESIAELSSHVTLRNNRIADNGVVGSWLEHNAYLQAVRTLVEGNYIGQLIPGAKGSSLKDRSTATVVRYNHVVAAARALDLVEPEGGVEIARSDPLFPYAWVYGNLIVDDWDNPGVSSAALIHWGGDNVPENFRNGTLYFYQNTVLSRQGKNQFWHLTVFDLPNAKQSVEAWSNVFAHYRNAEYRVANGGTVALGGNAMPRGWVAGSGGVQVRGRLIETADVKLNVDASLRDGSPALDRAVAADAPSFPAGTDAAALRPVYAYRHVARIVPRVTLGASADLGAFEYNADSIAIPYTPN